MDALSEILRADPPASVAALPDEVRDRLANQIVTAKERQAQLVLDAETRALTGVPLPLRGLVKKALSR
ncbi:MAG: hypothetical protein WB767_12915 [Nocardioides sp.]